MKRSAGYFQTSLFLVGSVFCVACGKDPVGCPDAGSDIDLATSTPVSAVPLQLTDAQVLPDKVTCVASTTTMPGGVHLDLRSGVAQPTGICTVNPTASISLPVELASGTYVLSFTRRFQPNGAVPDPGLAVLVRYSVGGVVQQPFSTTLQVPDSSIQKTCTCPAFEIKAPARLTDLFIGVSVPVGSNLEWYVQSPTLGTMAGAAVGTTCTCS